MGHVGAPEKSRVAELRSNCETPSRLTSDKISDAVSMRHGGPEPGEASKQAALACVFRKGSRTSCQELSRMGREHRS